MMGKNSTAATPNTKGKNKERVTHVGIYIILIFWAFLTLYPFIWVVSNSFRAENQIMTRSFEVIPDPIVKDNYLIYKGETTYNGSIQKVDDGALTAENNGSTIWTAYFNSIVISGCVVVFVVIFAGMASFGMTRYRFRGKKALDGLVISALMFPVFATIIPVYLMMSGFMSAIFTRGFQEPIAVIISTILVQIAGNLSFAMIVLMGYMRGLPVDLEESAFLEGCNPFQVFYKIVFPVSKPAFATVAIFSFLWSYNDLFTQSFFLRTPGTASLNVLLNNFGSQGKTVYGKRAAFVTLVIIPVMIVYIFLQKNIIKGLTAGAVKG